MSKRSPEVRLRTVLPLVGTSWQTLPDKALVSAESARGPGDPHSPRPSVHPEDSELSLLTERTVKFSRPHTSGRKEPHKASGLFTADVPSRLLTDPGFDGERHVPVVPAVWGKQMLNHVTLTCLAKL